MKKAYLVLQDGECFEGQTLLEQCDYPEKAGEVVFNTSHSGYEEIATDPSYFSQIVVMTAPMMGNYPVDRNSWESSKVWIQGFVCVQLQNSARENSWATCLIENQVPILTEVDTRRLVLKLRNQGTPWGALVHAENIKIVDQAIQEMAKTKVIIETRHRY